MSTPYRLLCALLFGFALVACGGGSDEEREGSPADPANQPRIEALDVQGSLGEELGAPDPEVADPEDDPVVQAVAGLNHVCALGAAGSVWCWGDPGNGTTDNNRWPVAPTRVRGAPPLRELVVPDVVDRGDGIFLSQRRSTCGRDDDGKWWCWGQHESVPNMNRQNMVTAVWAHEGIGELVRAGQPAPADIAASLDLSVGLADLTPSTTPVQRSDVRCALTRDGALWCWSNDAEGSAARHLAEFPTGTRLSGACALLPDGTLRCHLPFPDARPCPLNLTSMAAVGTRGCGERQDGTWACFGRPLASSTVQLPGLIDIPLSHCERLP